MIEDTLRERDVRHKPAAKCTLATVATLVHMFERLLRDALGDLL